LHWVPFLLSNFKWLYFWLNQMQTIELDSHVPSLSARDSSTGVEESESESTSQSCL
jgi:hypothetical protein